MRGFVDEISDWPRPDPPAPTPPQTEVAPPVSKADWLVWETACARVGIRPGVGPTNRAERRALLRALRRVERSS